MKTVGGSSSQDSYDRGDNEKLRKCETTFFYGVILLTIYVHRAKQGNKTGDGSLSWRTIVCLDSAQTENRPLSCICLADMQTKNRSNVI